MAAFCGPICGCCNANVFFSIYLCARLVACSCKSKIKLFN